MDWNRNITVTLTVADLHYIVCALGVHAAERQAASDRIKGHSAKAVGNRGQAANQAGVIRLTEQKVRALYDAAIRAPKEEQQK